MIGEVVAINVSTRIKPTVWEAHFCLSEQEKERIPEMLQTILSLAYQPFVGTLIEYRGFTWEVRQIKQFATTYKSREKKRIPQLFLGLKTE